jgi:hypothetical protein
MWRFGILRRRRCGRSRCFSVKAARLFRGLGPARPTAASSRSSTASVTEPARCACFPLARGWRRSMRSRRSWASRLSPSSSTCIDGWATTSPDSMGAPPLHPAATDEQPVLSMETNRLSWCWTRDRGQATTRRAWGPNVPDNSQLVWLRNQGEDQLPRRGSETPGGAMLTTGGFRGPTPRCYRLPGVVVSGQRLIPSKGLNSEPASKLLN